MDIGPLPGTTALHLPALLTMPFRFRKGIGLLAITAKPVSSPENTKHAGNDWEAVTQ